MPLRLRHTLTFSSPVPAGLPMVLHLGVCGLPAALWAWGCNCCLPASEVLYWVEYDVHGFFYFTPEST